MKMLKFSRRRVLGSFGALGAALAAPSIGRSQEEAIRVGAVPADFSGEVFYAVDEGFFGKAGLNVDLQQFTNGGAVAQAVLGGALDIGLSDLVSVAAGHARGVPFTYIAPAALYAANQPTYFIGVTQNAPIRTAKDFNGKTVAVNGLKNVNQIPTQAWIDKNGGDSKSVKFVEMPYPQMPVALDQGQVDAAALAEPFITFNHGKYRIISLGDAGIGSRFLVSGYVATAAWAAAHPEIVRKFAQVMRDTADWANKNPKLSAPILVKYAKLNPDVAQNMARTLYGDRLDPALLQPVIDATARYDVIPKPFPAREIISPDALR
jgi:ABC-type nitrate/sulfonate/bicarbonate transport system substrate-binding protein